MQANSLKYIAFISLFSTSLGTFAGLGCGVPQEIYNTRTRELDRCHADLTRTQADLTSAQGNADELANEASELKDRITTLETDRIKLSTNLSTQKQDLELWKNAAALAARRAELTELITSRLQPLVDKKVITLDPGKGRTMIRIGEAMLFDPGRAELRPDGQALLREIAPVMKQVNRDFLVACHSDNQPVSLLKGSPFKSSWELTTARAVAIVRFFQGEGVDPRHLGAAGYSEFNYIADNSDEAGRSLNRRIELILVPIADELVPLPPKPEATKPEATKPAPPSPTPPPSTPPQRF